MFHFAVSQISFFCARNAPKSKEYHFISLVHQPLLKCARSEGSVQCQPVFYCISPLTIWCVLMLPFESRTEKALNTSKARLSPLFLCWSISHHLTATLWSVWMQCVKGGADRRGVAPEARPWSKQRLSVCRYTNSQAVQRGREEPKCTNSEQHQEAEGELSRSQSFSLFHTGSCGGQEPHTHCTALKRNWAKGWNLTLSLYQFMSLRLRVVRATTVF